MEPTETHSVPLLPPHRSTPPNSPADEHQSSVTVGEVKELIRDAIIEAKFSSAPVWGTLREHPLAPLDRDPVLADLLAKLVNNRTAAEVLTNTPPASETEETISEGKFERASTLDYKRVDEVWDDKSGKYKIVGSTDTRGCELDQYVFVVRNRIDRRTEKTTAYVDINSTLLRGVMREICKDIRGVSLADVTPSIEWETLFHVRKELKSRRERTESDSLGVYLRHLDLLVDYTDATYKPTVDRLSLLLQSQEITYDLLWALFKPNVEVYTTCPGTGASRCVIYNQCEERSELDGSKYMHIEGRYLNSDGKALGEATAGIKIPFFRGAKQIQYLEAYPLQYHAEPERVRKELIQHGRTFVSLMGIHHRQYEGKAFFINEKGEMVSRYVRGKIMVDAVGFQESRPDYPCPRVNKVKRHYPWELDSPESQIKLQDIRPDELGECDFLICSPTVFGFSLDSKLFLELAVANIRDIEWSQSSFEDVKIPSQQKTAIWALAENFVKRKTEDGFTDLVRGKGRGINFLLYGPPGVGKTLTAETLAESLKTPLYAVPAGQIGVDPVQVEAILARVFKIASRWKAVLLIDEADIFMAQRSNDHLQLNALVSVFLRELEQYDGILFLTTNRLQTFDEAILSRIHVSLKYPELGRDAREAIWRYFVERGTTKREKPVCSKRLFNELAAKKLNGREIRNAVFVAMSMAEHEGIALEGSHLESVIASKEQFYEDFNGAGALENQSSYL